MSVQSLWWVSLSGHRLAFSFQLAPGADASEANRCLVSVDTTMPVSGFSPLRSSPYGRQALRICVLLHEKPLFSRKSPCIT